MLNCFNIKHTQYSGRQIKEQVNKLQCCLCFNEQNQNHLLATNMDTIFSKTKTEGKLAYKVKDPQTKKRSDSENFLKILACINIS